MSNTKTYEGMFLVDAGVDFGTASEPVKTVLGRSEANLLSLKPWEERRLAYEIGGRKRGMYMLAYFEADPEKIVDIERDMKLNEDILRGLILRKEDLTEETINAETPATQSPRREGEERPSREGEGKPEENKAEGEPKTEEKPAEPEAEAKPEGEAKPEAEVKAEEKPAGTDEESSGEESKE
ncbi:MAG: 30S ribosomal protein S6 [Phycisphaerae bacterium]